MKRIISCPNGHYYDADQNASCPECARLAGSPNPFNETIGPENIITGPGAGSFGATEPVGMGDNSWMNNMGDGGYGAQNLTEPVVGGMEAASPFGVTETAPGLKGSGQMDPIVGWLVCIDGPMRGQDYRIHDGYNFIGRAVGDIVIKGDDTISAEKAASVTFDSECNAYYLSKEQGKNIIRVNKRAVLSDVELQDYDVVTIGTTKLLFIGLCGEKFDWKEGVK